MTIAEEIVSLVFRAQGRMTMDELCSPGSEDTVVEAISGELDRVLHAWIEEKARAVAGE